VWKPLIALKSKFNECILRARLSNWHHVTVTREKPMNEIIFSLSEMPGPDFFCRSRLIRTDPAYKISQGPERGVEGEVVPGRFEVFSPQAFADDLGHSHSKEEVVDMKCNYSAKPKNSEY
jgi:hypothetical protein